MKLSWNTALVVAVVCLSASRGQGQEAPVPSRLSLEESLSLAVERNPTLAIARQGVDIAEADRLDASLRPNPAVTFESENYPLFESSRPGFWNGQEFTFRVDQEIETAGRRGLRRRAASVEIDAARAVVADAQRRLELEVRRAYLQVVLAKTDLDVSTRTLGEIDQLISLNRARFEQGDISGVELRRLRVERLRFADDASAAELALRNARSALLALLGYQNLGQPFDVSDALKSPGDSSAATTTATTSTTTAASVAAGNGLDVAALQSRALANRQDVMAARAQETRADTQTRLQHALRTPNVTVGGGYRRDFGTNAVVFGVTVPLPLTNRNQGGIARAEAERRVAASQRTIAETAVRLDVQQAVNAVEVARSRVLAIEQEYLPSSRQALDTVLASYRVGAADLIDLFDAQRASRETQRTFNRALFDWNLSLAELAAAVGDVAVRP